MSADGREAYALTLDPALSVAGTNRYTNAAICETTSDVTGTLTAM